MTAPTFSATTERLYERLPDAYREADIGQDYALKKWLAGTVDQQGQVEAILDRIDYVDAADRGVTASSAVGPTGEKLRFEAEDMTRVGSWTTSTQPATPEALRMLSSTLGSRLEQEFFVQGGTYTLTMRMVKKPNYGFGIISVDRDRESTVDFYTSLPSETVNQVLFTDLWLPRGYHTLRIDVAGVKRTESTGTWIDLSWFELVNVAGNAEDTSDLVDPNAADDEWLDWLGQLVGVKLPVGLSRIERRDAVRYAVTGFRSGTRAAVISAAKSELTGTRYARVFDHSTASSVGTASQWDVLIVTRKSETPAGADIVKAVTSKGAKPAGVVLYHRAYEASWEIIELRLPTWNDWENANIAGTWDRIEDVGSTEGLTVTSTALTLSTQ